MTHDEMWGVCDTVPSRSLGTDRESCELQTRSSLERIWTEYLLGGSPKHYTCAEGDI
jgi:hypothetical protein